MVRPLTSPELGKGQSCRHTSAPLTMRRLPRGVAPPHTPHPPIPPPGPLPHPPTPPPGPLPHPPTSPPGPLPHPGGAHEEQGRQRVVPAQRHERVVRRVLTPHEPRQVTPAPRLPTPSGPLTPHPTPHSIPHPSPHRTKGSATLSVPPAARHFFSLYLAQLLLEEAFRRLFGNEFVDAGGDAEDGGGGHL